jgi:hypothetical protein
MGKNKKRKSNTHDGPVFNKRPRSSGLSQEDGGATGIAYPNAQPRVDPVTGQRGAFPGLDDFDPSELFYGPANDGLEYLRMVR